MNSDDVIPPSPPVKLNKVRGRLKNSDTARQKKKRRSILSLRAKSRQQERSNTTDATAATNTDAMANANTEDENVASDNPAVCNVNIYSGIDDLSAEEKSNALSMLCNFDILSQPKLIEQCNQFDLKQPRQISASQPFAQDRGLVSLKELMLSSQNVHPTRNESSAAQILSLSRIEHMANEVSMENMQFSEWPLPTKSLNVCASNDKPHCTQQPFKTEDEFGSTASNQNENTSSATNASTSIVQSILDDFDDVGNLSQEAIAQTPPVVLIRRQNRKTYSRTHIASIKTVIFDDASVDKSFGARDSQGDEDDCDIECTQGAQDIDIDLNASRLIVENITRLSTFFTQPQSFELDFNTNLSQHSVTLDEEFREFTAESDDSECVKISSDFEEIEIATPNDSKLSQKGSPSVRLFDADDDIFVNITTPKVKIRPKSAITNRTISTPLSSSKGRFEESAMHSTPSTSKPAVPIEQRHPKRLQFGLETDHLENRSAVCPAFQPSTSKMQGFSTARGCTIEMSANHVKRTAGIFSNIDNEYKQIDPILEQMPNAKKRKYSNAGEKNENLDSSRSFVEDNKRTTMGGFQMASGAKATAINAQNCFREDFNDLAIVGPRLISNVKESDVLKPNEPKMGFATARGNNITVLSKHMERYAQTLEEVDRKLKEEFDIKKGVNLDDSIVAYKTPLKKQNYTPKSSTDVKPIVTAPSGTSMGFATARGSNIKVTTTNMEKYAQTLNEIDKNLRNEFDVEMNTNMNEEIVVCKTPMNKLKHQSTVFATSTPNPNAMSAFKNCPPITPISYQAAEHIEIEQLDEEKIFGELLDKNTQQLVSEAEKRNNTSVGLNDTMTNDFQLLNESITENDVDVLRIPEEIKHEREIMLSKQQAESFKKQHTIQPHIGWLQVQKVLSSTKLYELGPPKKFTKSDELEQLGVQRNVIEVSVENALQFKFDMWKFYGEEMCRSNIEGIYMQDEMCLIMDRNARVGVKELTSAFLQCPSVDPKLVPDHWTRNFLKWIIVKLASYERAYPHEYAGKCLTPENVS